MFTEYGVLHLLGIFLVDFCSKRLLPKVLNLNKLSLLCIKLYDSHTQNVAVVLLLVYSSYLMTTFFTIYALLISLAAVGAFHLLTFFCSKWLIWLAIVALMYFLNTDAFIRFMVKSRFFEIQSNDCDTVNCVEGTSVHRGQSRKLQ